MPDMTATGDQRPDLGDVRIQDVTSIKEQTTFQKLIGSQAFWVTIALLVIVVVIAMREPAFATLQRAFPQTRAPEDPTFRFGLTLDYLFLRLPDDWHAESRTLDSRFGSDHHPLLALVRRRTDARREW